MKGRASSSPKESVTPASAGCLKGLALLGGVGVLCIAWLLIEPAIHAAGVWWQRDSYVRTELEILSVNLRGRKNNAYGRVVTTNEKWWFNTSDFNELLVAHGTPLRTTEQLRGFRVPIWYHPGDRTWFFRYLRVLPAYPNKPLPDGMAVLGHVTILCGFIIAGVWLIRAGMDKAGPRRRQKKGKERPHCP
jgi:hypothetical protein